MPLHKTKGALGRCPIVAQQAPGGWSGDSDLQVVRCREKLKDMYTGFCKDYPIVTIEDPFDQDDWDATAAFTAEGVCQVWRTLSSALTETSLQVFVSNNRTEHMLPTSQGYIVSCAVVQSAN